MIPVSYYVRPFKPGIDADINLNPGASTTNSMEQPMYPVDLSFQEFIDAIQTADDEAALERVATRISHRFSFRWFAYLSLADGNPMLISSYPKSWTTRYFACGYEGLDPVVLRAKRETQIFAWDGSGQPNHVSREQRHFLDEASVFGIKTGVTVPIRGGFNRMAAFTFASEERSSTFGRLITESTDIIQLVGLYFHAHAMAKLNMAEKRTITSALSQRERQCLAWASRGKTIAEIASIVGISPRTITFHLENARQKLNTSSTTQSVAVAMRQGLLP